MSYEFQLHRILLYQPLEAGKDNLPDSKLVLSKNGRGVSDFPLSLYERSNDSHLRGEQQLLDLMSSTTVKMLSSNLGQLFVNQHHVWRRKMNVFHEVDDVTAKKFCDPAFVDQETARDTFVAQLCRFHMQGHTCNACLHVRHTYSPPIVDVSTNLNDASPY
ncbi:hypothetical protein TNCV_3449651 [Trichonephila clavipes]|nr:hypothetical protein TNCV_3449651 [Trichonephila clavipes]